MPRRYAGSCVKIVKKEDETMEGRRIYSINELTLILKVTQHTLYKYIKNGDLKARKIGKYWRVLPSDLETFLNEGTRCSRL